MIPREPLRQQMLRSLAENGRPPLRIVASNESAADWLIRVGPLAKQLNEQSKNDGGPDAA
jgi:hypothetical protein